MSLNTSTLTSQLESHALRLGRFDQVNKHEPKKAPGLGLTANIWAQSLLPVPVESGLKATTVRAEFTIRVMTSMLTEPLDAIDPSVLDAVDLLCAAYSADFTLGGSIYGVDLLGRAGPGMGARAGYLRQDSRQYRIVDIMLPLLVADLWEQAP